MRFFLRRGTTNCHPLIATIPTTITNNSGNRNVIRTAYCKCMTCAFTRYRLCRNVNISQIACDAHRRQAGSRSPYLSTYPWGWRTKMQNETLIESVTNEPIDAAGRRLKASSVDSDDCPENGSRNKNQTGNRHEEDAQRLQSLIALLQHAYLRLLAGDATDARAALERALASEGHDSLPIGSTSTPHMNPREPAWSKCPSVRRQQQRPRGT